MTQESLRELGVTASAYLAVAGIAAVVLASVAIYLTLGKKRWLPLERVPQGAWGGRDVVLAFCIQLGVQLLVAILAAIIISLLGLANDPPNPDAKWDLARWVNVASPITLAATLVVLFGAMHARSGTRPGAYGVSRVRSLANVGIGSAAFLLATPVVLGLHWLLALDSPEEHPFVELAKHLQEWEWGFLAFQATIQAPVVEEIVFRGILLGWLRRTGLIGHVTAASVTLFIAAWLALQRNQDFAGPILFAVALVVGYAGIMVKLAQRFRLSEMELQRWRPDDGDVPDERQQEWTRHNAWLAIYGSAMLFAVFHTEAWPAPIALTLLALALGWLAMRTHSLVAPITLHAFFNLVSLIVLYASRGPK